MLSREYTAYPGENEVLIQDGLQFRVIDSMIERYEEKEYKLIKLRYPAWVDRIGQNTNLLIITMKIRNAFLLENIVK